MKEENKKLQDSEIFLHTELCRYSHTLGLSLDYKICSTNRTINSDGDFMAHSIKILAELLEIYAFETNDIVFKQIADIVKKQAMKELAVLRLANAIESFNLTQVFKNFYMAFKTTRIKNEDLKVHGICLMALQAEDHGFYVAYNERYLTICNRGYFSAFKNFGIRVYNLKKNNINKDINEDNIRNNNFETIKEFENYFAQFIDETPILSISFKPQKIDNCSFANIKSIIKPLLLMLGESENITLKYKEFTTWVREYETKQLIAKYKLANETNKVEQADLYKSILKAYISKHSLDYSILRKVTAKSLGYLGDSVLSWFGRGDIKVSTSDESTNRRHNNIALIYKELKDDENFVDVWKPIKDSLEQIQFKEVVKNTRLKI